MEKLLKELEELEELAKPALAKDPSERTYEDRFRIWDYERFEKNSYAISDYDEGEEVFIYDGEKLSNNEIKDGFGNDFPEWFREAGKHFGEEVRMVDNKEYTLIGMSYTYLDYYYLLVNSEGEKCEWSCVGEIEFLG